MPYDATDFDPDPKPPPPPRRDVVKERIICGLVLAFAVLSLVLPISAGTLADIARAVFGR